jgi:hypothetical protein
VPQIRPRSLPHLIQVINRQLPYHSTLIMAVSELNGAESFLRRSSIAYPHFMEPECPLPCLKQPSPCICPEPVESSPRPHPISLRSILISSMYSQIFKMASLPKVFPIKILYAFASPPYMLHVLPISSFYIWNLGSLFWNIVFQFLKLRGTFKFKR